MAELAPELSWLLLTSAVETAANQWRSTTESPVERLRASLPQLEEFLRTKGDEEFVRQVAEMLAPYMGVTKKFIDFMLEFLPEPPPQRPESSVQHLWEPQAMTESLKKVYGYRSRALHDGKPFPAHMCIAPQHLGESYVPAEIPVGKAMSTQGGTWLKQDMPMLLHTYEYLVRNTLQQ